MKIPTGTSFVSDHRFGVRAVWPSRAERDDSGLRQRSRMTPERRVADSGRPDGSAHTDRGGQLGDPGPLVVLLCLQVEEHILRVKAF